MVCILYAIWLTEKSTIKNYITEQRHRALHINRNWHALFFTKNADWHINVQYLCFVKPQGHKGTLQITETWTIWFVLQKLAAVIWTKTTFWNNTSLYRSLLRLHETRETFDTDVDFWQKKKKEFGLRDTDVPFWSFQSKNNEWLSVFKEQSHKVMFNINFKKEDK